MGRMTVNSGYKRWLGCVLEKKGFRIICLFVLSVCFVFCYRRGWRRGRMGGDGRLSRRLELPESASTVLSESSALKMLHLQVPLYILGGQVLGLCRNEAWYNICQPQWWCLHWAVRGHATCSQHIWKGWGQCKVPSSDRSSLLPLSLTRTPHQSLIMCSVGLSCVTRLMRYHSRDWCMKCRLRI